MAFELPPLPYEQDALEPHLSADVVKYHYGKHTKKYFDVANELAKGTVFETQPLDHVISKDSVIRMGTALYNNVSQAWNHAFYWQCLCPESQSGDPSKQLVDAIIAQYQTFDKFKEEFDDKATKFFGSGWAWVMWKDNRIQIKTTPNAGSPLTERDTVPLLTCDLWEHAHYLQYPADRASYIKGFWNIVNWKFVSDNFKEAVK
jgi:superoxide dismutase, Fe-Mn family